jgi:hypothetical protein
MIQRAQTVLTDDLDGSEAVTTVRFSIDGKHYEIDLNAVHAEELRDIMAKYAAAGRKSAAGHPAAGELYSLGKVSTIMEPVAAARCRLAVHLLSPVRSG